MSNDSSYFFLFFSPSLFLFLEGEIGGLIYGNVKRHWDEIIKQSRARGNASQWINSFACLPGGLRIDLETI